MMKKMRMTWKMMSKEEKATIIAENVAKLIYVKGFSQVKLGNAVGVSHTAIQNYLNEKKLPSEEVLEKLASVAGVTTEQFLERGSF